MVATTAVLVPMYNEAAVIGDVVADLCRVFDLVVCVDDGSRDGSGDIARQRGALVLTHPVNLGQGAALRTGFDALLGKPGIRHVITFDADGQHDPADATAMLEVARVTGVDVVLGSRAVGSTTGQPLGRRVLLRAAVWVGRRTNGLGLTDTHNGLRVMTRGAVELLTPRQRGMAHASEIESLISRHRLTWIEHPVTVGYSSYSRAKGQGSLNAVNVVFDLVAARLHVPS